MSDRYFDRFLRLTREDFEIQGLCVKLPFMDSFVPVLDVKTVPEDPDMLKVVIASAGHSIYPPGLSSDALGPRDACLQNYFVHKSQVIFRTCERQGYSS